MSDPTNNESPKLDHKPTPINVPAPRPSSRRTISFSSRRTNFDSFYDPPVTTESQEAHGHHEEQNIPSIDPTLNSIEEDNHRQLRVEFSPLHKKIRKAPNSPPSRKFSRSRDQSSNSLTWSALKHFNESMEIPTSAHSIDICQRNIIYDEPPLMSPSCESVLSVIMDDGSLQRRRISLTSEYSRQNTVTEQTPLLHNHNYDHSDSDIEDTNRHDRYDRYDTMCGKVKNWFSKNTFTRKQKNIIKCALAYFIASLFTFVPILHDATGLKNSANGHLIATVAVFFNPAKTVGGMYEAVIYAILGGLWGSLIGIGSMASAVWFNDNNNYILGHIVTVVVWCGGSMFIVAYLKAKLNRPTFNSACSLVNIIIFVVLTKEGSTYLGQFELDKIIQVTKIILIGICISFLVSVCIWPVSASEKLKTEIGETLGSFRLLLKLLTKTFLIDDIHYTDQSVQSAIKSYQATFTSLKESLHQASHEIHNKSMQRQLGHYREVINILQRLAQYLGGLRSCCGLQWEIIKDIKDEKNKCDSNNSNNKMNSSKDSDEQENVSDDDEEFVDLGNLLEIIQYVGPSMKSLAFTCKQTISHLQDAIINSSTTFSRAPSFTLLHQNLISALELFEKSQTRSFTELYRKKTSNRPNEEVFLTYFFVFNLQEFTRGLTDLVDIVGQIRKLDEKEQKRRDMRKWWQFWHYFGCTHDSSNDSEFDKNFSEKIKRQFPENTNNLFNTLQTPIPKTLPQKFAIKIWKSLSCFRQFEVKYALKAAVSAVILASPSFIDETRPIYSKYRGEWACVSMMVVMVPTVGGTNLIGIYRAGGTLFGSFLALFIYTLFPDNGLVMSIFGFFIAIGCYNFILHTKYNRIGQFILLTYNLVALYKFNVRNTEMDLDIIDIARYRTIAVATGIIWGVFVTTYWWPYEARAELRKGLSQFFINMSWLYKKLVAVYSAQDDSTNPSNLSNQTLVKLGPHRISKSTKEFMEMELFLQLSLLKLKDLLSQTPNEPRMKGPFPVATYGEILMGCQNILDKLLSMRIAVTKEEWYTSIRRDFIIPVSHERKELVGNMLLYFYILAAALKLKTPLPPYLPPAEKARKRLIKKVRDLPVVKQRIIEGNDEHYIVYYAYVLVMEDIIRELEKLGGIMQRLFGCIGGDEFKELFRTEGDETCDDADDASGIAPRTLVQQHVNNNGNNNSYDNFTGSSRATTASQSDQNDATNQQNDSR